MSRDSEDQRPHPPEETPHTSWEAGGSLVDRLRTAPTGSGHPGADRAERVGSQAGLPGHWARTSEEAAQQATAAGHGSGGGPARAPVDVMQPVAEELDPRAERKAEMQIAACFLLAAACSIAFVIVYFATTPLSTWRLFGSDYPIHTPLLALFLGIGLFALGAGPVIWAKKLMPHEEGVQEREPFHSPAEERAATEETFTKGIAETGIQRRSLVRNSLLIGAGSLALPAAVPLLSLGRFQFKEDALAQTSFAEGVRLVTEQNVPVRLGDLEIGGILTVFPEGDTGSADAATMLIRLRPGEDRPIEGREDFAYANHVAYSKICTHAGCPVGLYEQQTHHLLCPCHQSTFLLTDGCKPIFGPATRSLPQLPIGVDEEGFFIARGDFPEPTGPGYWERA